MQILKNIHYMYLVFAVLFLFEFFIKFFQKNEITWASLALGIGAVFMFFFTMTRINSIIIFFLTILVIVLFYFTNGALLDS